MSVILGFSCVPLDCSKAYAELKEGKKPTNGSMTYASARAAPPEV
jgi:hypothetical protein